MSTGSISHFAPSYIEKTVFEGVENEQGQGAHA